jgi:hypothetical protein
MREALTSLVAGEPPRPEEVAQFLASLPAGDTATEPPSLSPEAKEAATRDVAPPSGARG